MDIYEQYNAAFARVEAFVITKDGKQVGTIAFKFPLDGAGRLYAYVHWHGLEMVRGSARGGGYDKRSSACRDASERMTLDYGAFRFVFVNSVNGAGWDRCLRDAGFSVLQAV